jgi:hypothetical protein
MFLRCRQLPSILNASGGQSGSLIAAPLNHPRFAGLNPFRTPVILLFFETAPELLKYLYQIKTLDKPFRIFYDT